MSEIGEAHRAYRKHLKENVYPKRVEKYIPMLENAGATKVSDGIYELDGWFLYPSKGFGMNKKKQHKRNSIVNILKRLNKEK